MLMIRLVLEMVLVKLVLVLVWICFIVSSR